MLKAIFTYFCLSLFFISTCSSLEPIESLVLGNFAENYSESDVDPLNYVFLRDKNEKTTNQIYKHELAIYRGFYEEGKNIINYCKVSHPIRYSTDWEKLQVMRSIFAETQYIGLDLISRALPLYAKQLEFSSSEYTNLIENLVGNYCSANLSVISRKELKNNMIIKFEKDNNFKLPSIKNNPFFPENMDKYLPPKIATEQEFKYTIKLFQSLCSWDGNPSNPGLMVPILKNPTLMTFIFRQLNNQTIDWKESDNTLYINEDKNTVLVWCDNLICRKMDKTNFNLKVLFSVGSTNLSEDLKKLYCEEFRILDYKSKDGDERIAKIIKSRSFDEENFINSQFIALITGVPDFLLRASKFSQGEDILRSSVDFIWDKWAKTQTENLNREMFFEEPITIELVARSFYFNPLRPKYQIIFDINLGEFDRINQKIGKVKVGFNLNIQRSFLRFYRNSLANLAQENLTERNRLLKRLKLQIVADINKAREKFIIPPWKGDLEGIIASEITSQLEAVADKNFSMDSSGFEVIPVDLNYGLFALKYINNQQIISKKVNNDSNLDASMTKAIH